MIAITINVIKVTKHFGFRLIARLLHILQFDAQTFKDELIELHFLCPITPLTLEYRP